MTWIQELYAGIDARDLGVLDRCCTADTVVRMANHPPAEGREAVREALERFWATIRGLDHELVAVVGDPDGDRVVVEAVVTCTLRDGRAVRVPAATVIERRDGLVTAQRIYADLAPLEPAG